MYSSMNSDNCITCVTHAPTKYRHFQYLRKFPYYPSSQSAIPSRDDRSDRQMWAQGEEKAMASRIRIQVSGPTEEGSGCKFRTQTLCCGHCVCLSPEPCSGAGSWPAPVRTSSCVPSPQPSALGLKPRLRKQLPHLYKK